MNQFNHGVIPMHHNVIRFCLLAIALIPASFSAEVVADGSEMTDGQRILLLPIADYGRDIGEVGNGYAAFRRQLETALAGSPAIGDPSTIVVHFVNRYVDEVRSALDNIKSDPDAIGANRNAWIKLYQEHYSATGILAGEIRRRVALAKYVAKEPNGFCPDLDAFQDNRDRPLLDIELSSAKDFVKQFTEVVSKGDYTEFASSLGYTARVERLPGDEWIAREADQYKSLSGRLTVIAKWFKEHGNEVSFSYFPSDRIAIMPTGKGAGWRRLLVAVDRKTGMVGFMNCE